jgi:hypothetical protein
LKTLDGAGGRIRGYQATTQSTQSTQSTQRLRLDAFDY